MEDERPSHDLEFVEYVVKSIVDHPDDVKVERKIDEMGVLITLSVNPEDMGQVIGRQGATAKSIRTLLRVIGARNNARVNLKIDEPEGSERPASTVRETQASDSQEQEKTPEPAVVAEAAEAAEPAKQTVDEAIDDLNL